MKRFTANFGRGFRGIYKARPGSRPAKLRELRQDIEDAQQSPAVSAHSVSSGVSSQSKEFVDAESQGGVAVSGPEAPVVSPQSVDIWHEVPEDVGSAAEAQAPVDEYIHVARFQADSESTDRTPSEAVDEQILRTQKYLEFEGEDETDYTAGPVRIVDAFDGVKESGALLMTLDFSQATQRAIQTQRDLAKAQRVTDRQLEVATNFEIDVECEIASHEGRLERLGDGEHGDEQKAVLQFELSTLEAMLQDSKLGRQMIRAELDSQATMVRQLQAEVMMYLEDAFVFAKLIQPQNDVPDTLIAELSVQDQYQAFCAAKQQEEGAADIAFAPLDTNRDHLQAEPLSLEEQARQDVRDAYFGARQRLINAEAAFDRREMDRAIELQANRDAASRGEQPLDATPEDFDARWVVRIQELTRELIDAEAALAAAKATALEAGIDFADGDQASGFLDDVADGYRMSFEQEQIASVPQPKVDSWLDGIPEQASPGFSHEIEADEWETRTVGVSDSVSLVAEGPERRRIDKWKRVCGF